MRQRQMNAEVTARLRELQTTIEAGAQPPGQEVNHCIVDGKRHAASGMPQAALASYLARTNQCRVTRKYWSWLLYTTCILA